MASDVAGGPIGVVVGMEAEARIARRLGWRVETGGGSETGAHDAAGRLLRAGARGLVSFGLCGGLDPALRPGTLLVPQAVLADGARRAADTALAARLGGLTPHLLLGWNAIAATAAEKSRLRASTGAVAVDMESGAVARTAAAHGVPFAVLRAVCDPAERDLPPAALAALDSRGAISALRIARSLLARPGQIPALIGLARDAFAARAALARAVTQVIR